MKKPVITSRGILVFSLKLPKNPSTKASLLLIQLHDRATLTEQDSRKNASDLCGYLAATIDRLELVELKNELNRRFPKGQNGH